MNIGLDLDNCVFDLEPLYKQAFHNTPYSYSIPSAYDVYKCYPKEIADVLKRIFKSKAVFYTELLDNGLPALINTIYNQDYHNIKILTSRIGDATPYIMNNIAYNGLVYETYQQLIRSGFKLPIENIILTQSPNKIDDIKANNINLMIDDSPSVISTCLKNNIPCTMISTEKTKYNHYLRAHVEYFSKVSDVILAKKLVKTL